MVKNTILVLAMVIVCQRLVEIMMAKRNRNIVLKLGAKEYGARHYWLFWLLHSCWLFGWITESWFNGWTLNRYWYIWAALFLSAQMLRYWCIVSLGYYWNTRILVVPGTNPVRQGPYKFLKHPNYLAVAIELLSVPLLCNALTTALLASICNAMLLVFIRIPAEEKAVYSK